MSSTNNIIILVARILLSFMFIFAGFGKLADPAGTAGMIAGAGMPAATALAYLAGLFEFVAGLAVLVGFQTKIAGWAIALFCIFFYVMSQFIAGGRGLEMVTGVPYVWALAIAIGVIGPRILGYFPSGHTATAFVCTGALATLIAWWRPEWRRPEWRRWLRAGVVAKRIPNPGGIGGVVTVSVGVATAAADRIEGLVASADVALYASKAAGRNTVRLAPELPPRHAA